MPEAISRGLSEALGNVLRVLIACDAGGEDIQFIRSRIWPPAAMDQIAFYWNERGEPVGFIAWAFVTKAVINRLQQHPNYNLHLSEWNEGLIPLVTNLFVVPGHAIGFVRHMRANAFANYRSVAGLRKARNDQVARLVIFKAR